MPNPSAAFLEALNRTAIVHSRARIQRRDATGEVTTITPPGTDDPYLAIAEGASISVDSNAAVRRTLNLPIADTDGLVPLNAASPILPFGNEIVVEMGVTLADGTEEYVTVGVFGIQEAETNDNGTLTLGLQCSDRAQKVIDARLTKAYKIAKTTNTATAIAALIEAGVPNLPMSFVSTQSDTPAMVIEEGADRWNEGQTMGSADGLDLYFDAEGILRLNTVPDPADPDAPIAFTFAEDGILGSVRVKVSSEKTYSHAVFTGEPQDNRAPVRADAYDTDPASPTYYLGPFGDKPVFLSTPIVSTDATKARAQAKAAAERLLNKHKGGSREISFTSPPIPSLEGGDLIRITRAASDVDAVFVLDSFTLPLDPSGEMTASVREVRL